MRNVTFVCVFFFFFRFIFAKLSVAVAVLTQTVLTQRRTLLCFSLTKENVGQIYFT